MCLITVDLPLHFWEIWQPDRDRDLTEYCRSVFFVENLFSLYLRVHRKREIKFSQIFEGKTIRKVGATICEMDNIRGYKAILLSKEIIAPIKLLKTKDGIHKITISVAVVVIFFIY